MMMVSGLVSAMAGGGRGEGGHAGVTTADPEPGDLAGAVPGRRSSSRSPVHCTCGSLNPPAELFLS